MSIRAFCGTVLLGAASVVSATPITGEIGMGGNFIAVDSSWAGTSIDSATGISFDPNMFIPTSATGSFSGVASLGFIKNFQFDDGPFTAITDFWEFGDFSFELTSITKLATSTATFLDLEGVGVMTGADPDGNVYDATIGSWTFTGDTTGSFSGANGNTLFSWSAGSAASVPEPGMLALMGIGLLGFAVVRRRT